jgi:predicted regulator of Ras-like GTPase activity (Roadblock/LC7/MglB family)
MTTAPTPTGKIRGSLRDVTQKLRNFVGAVKVTTPSGKGGILVDMGKPVAAYLTQDGVLHRGKASLDLLEKEELAEFEILRYDDEQFREAMIICENRGLLLSGEKVPEPGAPPRAREAKPKEEENILSAMMKRFAGPKSGEKKEPARQAPEAGGKPAAPPAVPQAGEQKPPEPRPPTPGEKAVPPPPAGESDLSTIIRRLRETGKIEKGSIPSEAKAEEIKPVPEAPVSPVTAMPPEEAPFREEKARPSLAETPAAEPAPQVGKSPPLPESQVPDERVRVDLGKMMKRIKRLDITSIRKELEEGAEAGGTAEGAPGTPSQPGAVAPSPVAGQASAGDAEAKAKSDIDELKAFIQKLEVLEEPREAPPPEKSWLAKLGVRSPAEEPPIPPPKKEVRATAPGRAKDTPEPVPATGAKPLEKPLEEPEPPRAPEPERKAKITSLLRRSGLVKPPAGDQTGEPTPEATAEPSPASEAREEAPAPAGEAGVEVPRLQRKKVEITRVPKKPEIPPGEPPLLDEKTIQKILKQPGVIAISAFFEGFAVQSAGRADFEQVAANAEDLFRAGKKIAREIDIGPLNQIILETGRGKLIIAPYGDLNVCIFTEPDANLGLIRVAIKGMQAEKER